MIIKKEIEEIDYKREDQYIAYADMVDDIYIAIRYMGMHPCCYIALDKNKYDINKVIKKLDNIVHGGVTCDNFSNIREYLNIDDDNFYLIGWDYGHLGDYSNLMYDKMHDKFTCDRDDRKYITLELLNDCKEAVKVIKEISKN